MEDKILEQTYRLMMWIENNFGRAGCFVFAFMVIAVIVLAFYLLNKLPEAKIQTVPEDETEI